MPTTRLPRSKNITKDDQQSTPRTSPKQWSSLSGATSPPPAPLSCERSVVNLSCWGDPGGNCAVILISFLSDLIQALPLKRLACAREDVLSLLCLRQAQALQLRVEVVDQLGVRGRVRGGRSLPSGGTLSPSGTDWMLLGLY